MRKKSPFGQGLQNIPARLWEYIARIEECKGGWAEGAKLGPQVLGRLKQSVLVTSTGASTRIEGAKLSDEDVEKLMRGIDIQKFADRDKEEAKGYFELLENVFNAWKGLKFSENTIKHFHGQMLKFVFKDRIHRGEYKKRENKVHMINKEGQSVGILFNTTPAYLTPKEMQELVEWTGQALAQAKHHPLLIIGNFLVEFLNIHPFQDGNGRLSRILTNLLLLKAGYLYMPYVSHEKLIEDNKPEYYLALRKSQQTIKTKKETIIPWLEFFLTILLKQSQMALDLLSGEKIERLLSKNQLAVLNYLEGIADASPKEIAQRLKIARPTVNQILNRLLDFKKIERIGLGRSTRYRAVK